MGKKTESAKSSKSIKVYAYYAKEGASLKRLKKSCPKCGQGYFMAQHKGRAVCGRCNYAEFG